MGSRMDNGMLFALQKLLEWLKVDNFPFTLKVLILFTWELRKKKRLLSVKYWLFNRDPCNGVLYSFNINYNLAVQFRGGATRCAPTGYEWSEITTTRSPVTHLFLAIYRDDITLLITGTWMSQEVSKWVISYDLLINNSLTSLLPTSCDIQVLGGSSLDLDTWSITMVIVFVHLRIGLV